MKNVKTIKNTISENLTALKNACEAGDHEVIIKNVAGSDLIDLMRSYDYNDQIRIKTGAYNESLSWCIYESRRSLSYHLKHEDHALNEKRFDIKIVLSPFSHENHYIYSFNAVQNDLYKKIMIDFILSYNEVLYGNHLNETQKNDLYDYYMNEKTYEALREAYHAVACDFDHDLKKK